MDTDAVGRAVAANIITEEVAYAKGRTEKFRSAR
jgi:hypothetical protein